MLIVAILVTALLTHQLHAIVKGTETAAHGINALANAIKN